MIERDELIRRIDDAGTIRRWYQSVPYGSIISPNTHFGDERICGRSYGDGRWQFYINPMLQRIEYTESPIYSLCEIGCSAGLFLLRTWQKFGCKKLIGVEAGLGAFRQLEITRDFYDVMPLKIHHASIGHPEPNIETTAGAPLDLEHFPIVDVMMLSCVHYHMRQEDLFEFIKAVLDKVRFLILVTDEGATGTVCSPRSVDFIEMMQEIGVWLPVGEMIQTANPGPRAEFGGKILKPISALLFENPTIQRLPVDDCWNKQLDLNDFNSRFYREVFPKFIDDVLSGKITDDNARDSMCYEWQRKSYGGSTAWSPMVALERTRSYINIARTMKDNGQECLIQLNPDYMIDPWDGMHRIAVAHHLGIPFIYGRSVE